MGDREFLSSEEWAIVVKRHIGSNEFQVLNTNLKRLSEGVGFLGEHRLAEVTVRLQDTQKTRVLNFFIKAQQTTLAAERKIKENSGLLQKEVDVFSKLFNKLRSVLKNDGEDMQWSPKCYYTSSDVIVLEDMVVKGFHLLNSRIESRWQHCAMVLKSLSNLHSASFIFEEKHQTQPYRVDLDFGEMLREILFTRDENSIIYLSMKTGVKVVWKLVEEIHGTEALQRMKKKIEEEIMSLFELVKTSERFRNVVSHGDMWRNNIFFREEGGEVVEARLCDYQITRYTPPANDIICFLYITTSRSFRTRNLSQLLAFYHDQLTQNLLLHGLDPDKVLPWEEFKESSVYYKKLGIVSACFYCPFTLIDENDIKHVFESSVEYERFVKKDRLPEVMHAFKNDSFYRKKITEMINEFIEECIEKQ